MSYYHLKSLIVLRAVLLAHNTAIHWQRFSTIDSHQFCQPPKINDNNNTKYI